MSAGYSSTPLVAKLGFSVGARVHIGAAPEGFDQLLGALPADCRRSQSLRGNFDLIQFFARSHGELEREFPVLKDHLAVDGALWICWPKRAAKIETDLNGDCVRKTGLGNGLVDVKVCAVDEIWSGLKFVYRKVDRPR